MADIEKIGKLSYSEAFDARAAAAFSTRASLEWKSSNYYGFYF
jgi:hypothetical protein